MKEKESRISSSKSEIYDYEYSLLNIFDIALGKPQNKNPPLMAWPLRGVGGGGV